MIVWNLTRHFNFFSDEWHLTWDWNEIQKLFLIENAIESLRSLKDLKKKDLKWFKSNLWTLIALIFTSCIMLHDHKYTTYKFNHYVVNSLQCYVSLARIYLGHNTHLLHCKYIPQNYIFTMTLNYNLTYSASSISQKHILEDFEWNWKQFQQDHYMV